MIMYHNFDFTDQMGSSSVNVTAVVVPIIIAVILLVAFVVVLVIVLFLKFCPQVYQKYRASKGK